jgi:antitoxin component YwqK of YwqJK toxin-antitoxin module
MTKFSEMPGGKIKRWVAFAQSHDWGENAYFENGKICGCVEKRNDGSQIIAPEFETFDEMCDWAGY